MCMHLISSFTPTMLFSCSIHKGPHHFTWQFCDIFLLLSLVTFVEHLQEVISSFVSVWWFLFLAGLVAVCCVLGRDFSFIRPAELFSSV
jgi:hypothetical protein